MPASSPSPVGSAQSAHMDDGTRRDMARYAVEVEDLETKYQDLKALDARHLRAVLHRRAAQRIDKSFSQIVASGSIWDIIRPIAASNEAASVGLGALKAVILFTARVGRSYNALTDRTEVLMADFKQLSVYARAKNPPELESCLTELFDKFTQFHVLAQEKYLDKDGSLKRSAFIFLSSYERDFDIVNKALEICLGKLSRTSAAFTYDSTRRIESDVQKVGDNLKESTVRQCLSSLYIAGIDIEEEWTRCRRQKVEGTCKWISDGSNTELSTWRQEKTSHLLLLTGERGCGKSIAASCIIDLLFKEVKSATAMGEPSTLICSYTCKGIDSKYQNAKSTTRTLLFQSFTQRRSLIPCAVEVSDTHGGCQNLSFSRLWDIMLSVVKTVDPGQVYIVLDEFDQYKDQATEDLLDKVKDVDIHSTLKVLITCRDAHFKGFKLPDETLRISMNEMAQRDLRIIVSDRMPQLQAAKHLSADEKEQLTQQILEKAGRCTLWVDLVLKALGEITSGRMRDLEDIIEQIPPELEQLYLEELRKIRKTDQLKAVKMLRILVGARRRLTVREFRHASAIDNTHSDSRSLEKDDKSDQFFTDRVIRVLGLLVRVVDGCIELVHQTLAEFLTNMANEDYWVESGLPQPEFNRLRLLYACPPLVVNRAMSLCCVSYLLMDDCFGASHAQRVGYQELETEMPYQLTDEEGMESPDFVTRYQTDLPLFPYAAEYWASHVSLCEYDAPTTLLQAVIILSDVKSVGFCAWADHYRLRHDIRERVIKFPPAGEISALVIAAYFGHLHVLRLILMSRPELDLTELNQCLNWASVMNQAEIISCLLSYFQPGNTTVGGSKLPEYSLEKALGFAARSGSVDVVKALLAQGEQIDVNWYPSDGMTALTHAVSLHHLEVVEVLLEDRRTGGASLEGLILYAKIQPSRQNIQGPSLDVLKHLLNDPRVNISTLGSNGRSLLSYVCQTGNDEAVRLLLSPPHGREAQVDALLNDAGDVNGETPILYAARGGYLSVIRALAEAGDMTKQMRVLSVNRMTAIAVAVQCGHAEIVRFLAELDPDGLNTQVDLGMNLISFTADAEEPRGARVAEVLLDWGAASTLEARSEMGSTALEFAVRAARYQLIDTLVNKGGARLGDVISVDDSGQSKLRVRPSADWEWSKMLGFLSDLAKAQGPQGRASSCA